MKIKNMNPFKIYGAGIWTGAGCFGVAEIKHCCIQYHVTVILCKYSNGAHLHVVARFQRELAIMLFQNDVVRVTSGRMVHLVKDLQSTLKGLGAHTAYACCTHAASS